MASQRAPASKRSGTASSRAGGPSKADCGKTSAPARRAPLGVEGTAPGFIDVEATAYLGESGRAAARFSAARDMLFTQRLILQPQLEVNLFTQADPENRIGAGLSSLEVGLRLRYEIRRELAPYLGTVWQRRFGETARLERRAQEDPNDWLLVAGLRVWF